MLKNTLPLLSCLLGFAACASSPSDLGGNGDGQGQDELNATDAAGDIVCAEDPDAVPVSELDILAIDIEPGSLIATITFNGNIEAWHEAQSETLPFSLQLWTWSDVYIEAFFDTKTKMKVSDGIVDVSHSFSDDTLTVTLDGVEPENIMRGRVSTFRYDGLNYSGSCDDELEFEPG